LGANEIDAPSATEIFENIFPYYLAMGMSYEQFWVDDPKLVIAYRRADEIRKRRMNEELWLNGIYMTEAIASTVGNMFSKGQKHQYPSEPKPITQVELEERRVREQKAREERIKARFTARALAINASKGVT
jgi:hypothetical protein